MDSDEKFTFLLHFYENRLATFVDWPFDDSSSCAADKMAAAGFYHCPSEGAIDNVKCYVCGKELEGWEVDDDPIKEHKKHSGSCSFLTFRNLQDITLNDLILHIEKRMLAHAKESMTSKREDFTKEAKKTRQQIEALAESE